MPNNRSCHQISVECQQEVRYLNQHAYLSPQYYVCWLIQYTACCIQICNSWTVFVTFRKTSRKDYCFMTRQSIYILMNLGVIIL